MTNALQTLLSLSGWTGFFICFLLIWAIWQFNRLLYFSVKWIVWAFRFLMPVIVRPTLTRLTACATLALCLFLWRLQVSDALQYVEQMYIAPVYAVSDTSTHALACFESKAKKYLDSYEFETFKTETASIAAQTGSTPLAFYMVYLSECGMNPFIIRDDGNAAGPIQFTRTGLEGLKINDKPATIDMVKAMCVKRDIVGLMRLTREYMIDRAKGKPLQRPCDVYTCVFAPSFVGADESTVLYQGYQNPQYYKNAGLDGYRIVNRRYIRLNAYCDGKLTISDLQISLEAKKAALLRSFVEK
jgi:hypothetical protein